MSDDLLCAERFRLRKEYIQRLEDLNRDMHAWAAGTPVTAQRLKLRLTASRVAWDHYLAHATQHGCGRRRITVNSNVRSM